MNAFLCLIDADRNEKKGLLSPGKLVLVNFKVSEVVMKVSLMASSMCLCRVVFREEQEGALRRSLFLITGQSRFAWQPWEITWQCLLDGS